MDSNLFAGLAAALKSGSESYLAESEKQRKEKKEDARDKLARQLELDKAGYEESAPETYTLRPDVKTKRDYESQGYTADSARSKAAQEYYKGLLASVAPGKEGLITPSMTATELEGKGGLLGGIISGEYGVKAKKATEAIWERRLSQGNERLGISRERLGMAKDDQAKRAADTFDSDTTLKTLGVQQQNIRRGKHTLDTVKQLTPQLFNEIQMDIANAISGGRSAAVSTQNKAEFHSLEIDLANLEQRLSSSPQDIGSPEVKAYIRDILGRLDEAYQQNMADRAGQLSRGRKYESNPRAQEALDEKSGQFKMPEKAPEGAGLLGDQSKGLLTAPPQKPGEKPDFGSMTDEQLKAFLGGK